MVWSVLRPYLRATYEQPHDADHVFTSTHFCRAEHFSVVGNIQPRYSFNLPIQSKMTTTEPPSRSALRRARRVLVKAGTSVVANEDGRPSLTRVGALVEQISELTRDGVEVIFVSSGAVGMGKRPLRKQTRMAMSFNELQADDPQPINSAHSSVAQARRASDLAGGVVGSESHVSLLELAELPDPAEEKAEHYGAACAATGQAEMMKLYCSLFGGCEVTASQLLVTQNDFRNDRSVGYLANTVERLLGLGIVPIINENDAVFSGSGDDSGPDEDMFSDNDSLAALCARTFGAEVCLLLTDVEGVYDRPPSEAGAKKLSIFRKESSVTIGEKSSQGKPVACVCDTHPSLVHVFDMHIIYIYMSN